MKKPFTFDGLSEPLQARLRRIYHTTTATNALRIAQSGHIWSKDPCGFANFSINRNPYFAKTHGREVSLSFSYSGEVAMVGADFPPDFYDPNLLYIHFMSWPNNGTKDGMQISAIRAPAGTSKGLVCTGYRLSDDFHWKSRTNPNAAWLADELRTHFSDHLQLAVPRDFHARELLASQHPPVSVRMGKVATWAIRKVSRKISGHTST